MSLCLYTLISVCDEFGGHFVLSILTAGFRKAHFCELFDTFLKIKNLWN